jgi:hypothetical protein
MGMMYKDQNGVVIHAKYPTFSKLPQYKVELRDYKSKEKIIQHLIRTERSIRQEIKLVEEGNSTLPKYAREAIMQYKQI